MLGILNFVIGAILLVAGRKLFWLLVAGIGFVIGVLVAARFYHGSELILIAAGVLLGILFAALAIFLKSIAISVAGFLGGGYIFLSIAGMLGYDTGVLSWIIFVVGGVLGALLMDVLFNWALISISSFAGAAMIIAAFGLIASRAELVYLGLVIAGVLIQGATLRSEQRAYEHPPKD